MKKKISLLVLGSLVIAGSAAASGFRIPEQSVDSTAKAAAHVASATGADSSYYNPANMSYSKNAYQLEADLVYINLPSVSYDDRRTPAYDGSSTTENFLIPTFFMVSPDYNNFRFGFSLTAPYGLSKRWEQPFPRSTAEEYSLHVLEMNPSVSYKISDMFSLGGGIRMIYGNAQVTSYAAMPGVGTLSRDMDADAWEFGWNLAASLAPTEESKISVTYRSKVDLDFEGDATMRTTIGGPYPYTQNTNGSVTLPAPGVLSVSAAYTFGPATVDLTWDRTFWSDYESIDIRYDDPVVHPALGAFTHPVMKSWDDSSAYRIGLEYELDEALTLMAGFAYDETPVPDATLGFELPDSDAWLYSLGCRYKINEDMEVGLAYLYDYKESRTVVNGDPRTGINGEFTDSAAHLLTAGFKFDF